MEDEGTPEEKALKARLTEEQEHARAARVELNKHEEDMRGIQDTLSNKTADYFRQKLKATKPSTTSPLPVVENEENAEYVYVNNLFLAYRL